ncbi:hypothetical protein FFI94_018875 [Rhodococcus sp. KBS0724]|uniref:hypothetical protein n=1 Tax=Rhodococcus sp. KBS0724 TaxID=1179674 RepID=UPI00110DF31C|nr:hypothetical protein [Rhodococcus sp. KBS0724]TSD47981.1 hypothetical protein FFI94_018875 [Rhodococcus sp. KBS0724]
MRQRIPSIAERTEVAIELGIIKPGEELTPRLQKKLAQTIQIAEGEEAEAVEAAASDPVVLIAKVHADLLKAGLTSFAADRIAAAIAPQIWRDN